MNNCIKQTLINETLMPEDFPLEPFLMINCGCQQCIGFDIFSDEFKVLSLKDLE
jgi:hypothetical protein